LGESSDVVNASAANCFTPFPNPVQHGQQLQWETPAVWTFIDGAGRVLESGQSNAFTVPEDIPSGVYTLRTADGMTARIVVR
jgi:hypothetical protein